MNSPMTQALAASMAAARKRGKPRAVEAEGVNIEEPTSEAPPAPAENKNSDELQVLRDPDAQKLAMKTYQTYVSEDDYGSLVSFLKDFDALLFKHRKGKPLTREEIDNIEEEQNDPAPVDDDPTDQLDPDSLEDTGEESEDEAGTEEMDDSEEEEPSVVVAKDGMGKDCCKHCKTPKLCKAKGECQKTGMALAAVGFKVCNECTGGTAPACKAQEKCLDKEYRKSGGSAKAIAAALILGMQQTR